MAKTANIKLSTKNFDHLQQTVVEDLEKNLKTVDIELNPNRNQFDANHTWVKKYVIKLLSYKHGDAKHH